VLGRDPVVPCTIRDEGSAQSLRPVLIARLSGTGCGILLESARDLGRPTSGLDLRHRPAVVGSSRPLPSASDPQVLHQPSAGGVELVMVSRFEPLRRATRAGGVSCRGRLPRGGHQETHDTEEGKSLAVATASCGRRSAAAWSWQGADPNSLRRESRQTQEPCVVPLQRLTLETESVPRPCGGVASRSSMASSACRIRVWHACAWPARFQVAWTSPATSPLPSPPVHTQDQAP